MKKDGILLLGGTGFIGSALARQLSGQNRRVYAISRSASPDMAGVIGHRGDLADKHLLKPLLHECGTVVHLASDTTPGSSARRPGMEFATLQSTLHFLDLLQDWQDTHLIFLSSGGTVYGNPAHNPVTENTPLAPLSYHGAGKVAVEGFLHAFRSAGHAVTILRPSNTYGPGQSLRQGFGLIRTVLQHALHGSTMEIWGDGRTVRDFIHIGDVVDAVLLAIDSSNDSGTYNVGSGKGYTLNQVVTLAEKICGVPLHVEYRPSRGVDVREVVLDISSIRASLGWSPGISLEEGIHQTWQWLRKS